MKDNILLQRMYATLLEVCAEHRTVSHYTASHSKSANGEWSDCICRFLGDDVERVIPDHALQNLCYRCPILS